MLHEQVVNCNGYASGRILSECSSCISAFLSKVVHALKASPGNNVEATATPIMASETLKTMMDHVKTSGLVDHLCLCLAIAGSSLQKGASNFLHAAGEACKALWLLIHILEILLLKQHAYQFPLDASLSNSLLRLDIKENEQGLLVGKTSTEVVNAITGAILNSKPIQVSLDHCIRQRLEPAASASIQVHISQCNFSGKLPFI